MMKKGILILCTVFLIIWSGSLIKCEINTLLYGNEFVEEYKQTNMIGGTPKPKVLKYTDTRAEIYYVDKEDGNFIVFQKKNNKWVIDSWDTIWSKTGSADGFIWPYGR